MEEELADYLRFRRLFRHTYGYDLKWARVRELGQGLPGVLQELKVEIAGFLRGLAEGQ